MKLIVLERLSEMRAEHVVVLQDLVLDLLRALGPYVLCDSTPLSLYVVVTSVVPVLCSALSLCAIDCMLFCFSSMFHCRCIATLCSPCELMTISSPLSHTTALTWRSESVC